MVVIGLPAKKRKISLSVGATDMTYE